MTWLEWIQLIPNLPPTFFALVGGIIGASSTAIIGFRYSVKLKDVEYLNAYYTKIMEKRIAAYEMVEELINVCNSLEHTPDFKVYHPALAGDDSEFFCLWNACRTAMNSRLWISAEAMSCLMDVSSFLNEFAAYRRQADVDGAIRLKAALDSHNEFVGIKNNLKVQFHKDFLKLHHIDSFLKEPSIEKFLKIPKTE